MSDTTNIIDDESTGPDGRGWVCLHRRIRESAIFASMVLLKVWVWALTKATHRRIVSSIRTGRGTSQVEVLPGQFIYGRNVAAEELDMPPSTVHDAMQKLKSLGSLDIKPDTHCSLITICNWKSYQDLDAMNQQATRHPSDNQATTNRHIQPHKPHKQITSAQSAPDGFADWWKTYPRKVVKRPATVAYAAALKRIQAEKSIDANRATAELLTITTAFAEAVKGTELQYIPYPTTFLNEGRYDDDPATWKRTNGQPHNANPVAARPRTGRYDADQLDIKRPSPAPRA